MVARGLINPDNPDFKDQIDDFLLEKGLMDDAERVKIVNERIESIKNLAGITNKNLSVDQKKKIAQKWGKRGLGLLALLLSPLFLADINKLLQDK